MWISVLRQQVASRNQQPLDGVVDDVLVQVFPWGVPTGSKGQMG
jgi:hypothetical protein